MGDLIDLGAERWRRRGQGVLGPRAAPMLVDPRPLRPLPVVERSLPDDWQPLTTLEVERGLIGSFDDAEAAVEHGAPTVAEQILDRAERALVRQGRSTRGIRKLRERLGL